MDMVKFEHVESKVQEIRGVSVILDSDLAELYGVETRDINKAVKNNPDKFPSGYLMELTNLELDDLRGKFSTAKFVKTRVLPKAFTEKGLYMLATILKSPQAVQTTFAIIETFAKIRELSRNIKTLSGVQDKAEQQTLMRKSGEIIAEILDDELQTTDTETVVELNFAVLKFKHTIKKKGK
ncbi:ORF6N domain-containing protein [Desulfonatronum thiosulfatophilum]|uniref:ORF6N domain-containing protein n=1 Tax=Desulfonatronum thiosulfatophilum TaxID=617002 RepID=A0A1G6EC67_9BACT|nr:ORF6N domain-containing protein [Desulfonatronum thiosulfatophilum]SDB54978.1 ORF6N domain-containing protein [Desulfonatronum thiosulfatophilum]